MNILSFDIEEWYIEKEFNGGHHERYQEYDRCLKTILDILDETNTQATFFCLGQIAKDFPEVIRSITEKGHEIGCHSNRHLWLTKMTPDQLKDDTRDALSALQDVSGQAVFSYRAPAFSIGEDNKWTIEVIAAEGILRDSSIFPAVRDFGGFASFPTSSPTIVSYNGISLQEYPICVTSILGKEIAYSGGGYFRLFPYEFIRNRVESSDYAMAYFHINDLLNDVRPLMSRQEYEIYFKELGSLKNRVSRFIKSNLGTRNAMTKMKKLITHLDFITMSEASQQIDWTKVEVINI